MEEFTLKPGPKKFAILFGFAIVAFLLGWFIADSMTKIKPILGYIVKGILIWGSGLLILLLPVVWLLKKSHITISKEGIHFNDSRKGFGLIPWSELGEIQTSSFIFIPVIELYHKNESELMQKITDPKKKKNIELISMISSTPLGINMLFYDVKAVDLKNQMKESKILIPGQGRLKRMRIIIFVFLGLAGIALWQTIAFKTTSGLIVTSIMILCCFYLLIVLPIYWKNPALHIKINPEGISYGDARRAFGLIPWTKIESVDHMGKGMKEIVLLQPSNLDQLMSFVEDPNAIKGLTRLTKIHGSPLGIQMLYFDENSEDLVEIVNENIKNYG